MKIKQAGEFGLIDRINRSIQTGKDVVAGIGDDAAVLTSHKKGFYTLFTCDMFVEDVHFTRRDVSPRALGRKAMGAAISDIAAMGGLPQYAVISLGLSGEDDVRLCDALYRGMRDVARRCAVDIVGGDTVSSPKGAVLSIAVIGEVEKKECILRSGARKGEAILVTGTLGGSMMKKHVSFTPRVREARFLTRHARISSMMDVTDGLAADLEKICAASGVGALLFAENIPVSSDARRMKGAKTPLARALSDGEDFELLCTVPVKEVPALIKKFRRACNVPLSLIGSTTPEKGLRVIRKDGSVFTPGARGYDHFKI
jgi:thiamine-monophosphate kinase